MNSRGKEIKFGLYIILFLLFFIWPFGGLFIALISLNIKEYRYYIIPFFFLLGYSITFKLMEADSYGYGVQFVELRGISFLDFLQNSFLKGETVDLFKTFLYLIVGYFTNNPKVLFGFVGLIFGLFFIKCIELFVGNIKMKFIHYYLLIVFSFVIPYSSLNGFRFWIASFYFVYALFLFSKNKELKYLLLVFSTTLIHFSFVLPSFFVLIFYFVGNKPKLYFIIFVITFLINNTLNILVDIGSSFLSNIYLFKLNSYTTSSYAKDVLLNRGNTSRMFLFLREYPVWYMYIAVCVTKIKGFKYKFNNETNNLFSVLLLLFIFINLLGDIPSIGRYISVILLLALYYMVKVYQLNRTRLMRNLIYLSLPAVFLSAYLGIELGISLFSSKIVTGSLFSILMEKSYLIH